MKRKREKGGAGGNRICKISNRIDQITSFKIPKLDIYAALEREREREKEGKNTFDENIHPRFTYTDNRYIREIKFHFLPPSWPGTHNCGILNGRVAVASQNKKRKKNHLNSSDTSASPESMGGIRSVYNRYLVAGDDASIEIRGRGREKRKEGKKKKIVPRDKLVSSNGSALSREIERIRLPMPRVSVAPVILLIIQLRRIDKRAPPVNVSSVCRTTPP